MPNYITQSDQERRHQYITDGITERADTSAGPGSEFQGEILDATPMDDLGATINTDTEEDVDWDTLGEVMEAAGINTYGMPSAKFWIGSGSMTSPLHFDTFPGIFVQMGGAKKSFYLWPPEEFPRMYLCEYTNTSRVINKHEHSPMNLFLFARFRV
jgi:hypothetical protein